MARGSARANWRTAGKLVGTAEAGSQRREVRHAKAWAMAAAAEPVRRCGGGRRGGWRRRRVSARGVNWVEAFSGGRRFSGCGFELLVRETAVCVAFGLVASSFFARVL